MKKLYYLFLIVPFVACNGEKSSTTNQTESHDHSDSSALVRKPEKPKKISSLQEKDLNSLNEMVGLFAGRFETDTMVPVLQKKWDKYISDEMGLEDGDYLDVWPFEEFYNSLSDQEKKFMYKDPLFGYYQFRTGNAITLSIDKIDADSVYGKSVCAGNEREVRGYAEKRNDSLFVYLAEPGTDKYDGKFWFYVDLNDNKLLGEWTPYNTNLHPKKLELKSTIFTYAPNGEEWNFESEYFDDKNISLDLLAVEDVENQPKHRLRILRNLIYARHGYSFKTKDVREFFEGFEWYVPVTTDVREVLTETEKTNIALIKRYEQYAEDYYDEFGR